MAKRNLKINYCGFLGFLGFMGFQDPWYFFFFLFFLFFFVPNGKNLPDLIEKQAKEKEEHKKKVLDFANGKDKITNNDIEKLLGVSDATAERYLNELEKSGALKQVGKEGRDVFYSKP